LNGRDVFAAVWRRKVVAILVLVLTLAATGAYLATASKTYRARATLTLVPPANANLSDFNGLSGPLLSTLADVVVSEPVLSDAARALDPQPTTQQLRSVVTGSGILQTLILRVEATDAHAERSAQIANAVASALIVHNPNATLGTLTVVDPATKPTSPISPDKFTSGAIGLLLGVVLAALAATIVDRRRTRAAGGIVGVERALGAPVLARLGGAAQTINEEAEVQALVARLRPALSQTGRMAIVILEAEESSGLPNLPQQLARAFVDGRSQILNLHGPLRSAFTAGQPKQKAQSMAVATGGQQGPEDGGAGAGVGNPPGVTQLATTVYDFTVDSQNSEAQVTHALGAFDVVIADGRDEALVRYLPELFRRGSVLIVVRQATATRSQLGRISRELKEDGTTVSGVILT
jgi:capsular polysaccharide biosynthesis protein